MDLTTFATSWAPLLLSLAVVIERIWSRANGQLERKVDALHRRLDTLRSFRDRVAHTRRYGTEPFAVFYQSQVR